MTPEEFITAIGPAAQTSAAVTKIPASFTVAEAALESGWGVHAPGMNLFGIKADSSWDGLVTMKTTREFRNGEWVVEQAHFRAYTDWKGSIMDHAQFLLTNPRYKACFDCEDGEGFARAVAEAGYATDPNYANSIISIIRSHNLTLLDQE
jgi:flagellum-specific peptidoglycan hydrolase FlgJ